jgi:hypothetical protein
MVMVRRPPAEVEIAAEGDVDLAGRGRRDIADLVGGCA